MKNLIFLWMIICSISCQKEIPSPYVIIPDKAFETRLIDLGVDSDKEINGKLLRTDAEKVDSLNVINPHRYSNNTLLDPIITSLKGIEAFTNLKYLECSWNEIDSLDLSKNLKLVFLSCNGYSPPIFPPQVTLNIKNYILLPSSIIYLYASLTSFTKFNSTDLANIEILKLSGGNYNRLDLSNCPRLREFGFYSTSNTIICVKNMSQITDKWVQSEKITYEVCK